MRSMIIWEIASMVYARLLRDLIVKAINDPDSDWDDVLLRIVDSIFDYGG